MRILGVERQLPLCVFYRSLAQYWGREQYEAKRREEEEEEKVEWEERVEGGRDTKKSAGNVAAGHKRKNISAASVERENECAVQHRRPECTLYL